MVKCEVSEVMEKISTFSGCQMQALFLKLLPLFRGNCVEAEYLETIDTDSILTEIAENRDFESRKFLVDLFKCFTPHDDAHLVAELEALIDKAEREAEQVADELFDEMLDAMEAGNHA